MGGLGTLQNGMAAGSIYGPDVDMLMWDSGMTEREASAQDLFHRQAMISPGKVPILWSLSIRALQHFDKAGADVGYPGDGSYGVPKAKSIDELNALPWAARYLSCSSDLKRVCSDHEYDGVCWIKRDDFKPNKTQGKAPGGRASWHPGNRHHQIRGRVLAFTILSALKEALQLWQAADGYILSDDTWHLTNRYEEIRSKVLEDVGPCHETMAKHNLTFACKYPVKARTEFTPRAYPPWTHIRSLLPPGQRETIGEPTKNEYDPPDVFNPSLHPPKGSVDVLNIVEQGVVFKSVNVPDYTAVYEQPSLEKKESLVAVGKGCVAKSRAGDPFCDGSVDSFCARAESGCMLYGHNDGRNGIAFDGYSGWLVMRVPAVKYGYIAVKYHSWHQPDGVWKTEGWDSINNENPKRKLNLDTRNGSISDDQHISHWRSLKAKPLPFCKEFQFEYAIDGKVTILSLSEWESQSAMVQRVVEILPILQDSNYTGGVEKTIEVAIRITGCGRKKQFQLTHIYWA